MPPSDAVAGSESWRSREDQRPWQHKGRSGSNRISSKCKQWREVVIAGRKDALTNDRKSRETRR